MEDNLTLLQSRSKSMPRQMSMSYGAIPTNDTGIDTEVDTEDETDADMEMFLTRQPSILWIRSALSDLCIRASVVIAVTIAISTICFKYYNGWETSTSLFFACQTIVGIMYGEPEETDRLSQSLTMLLYFLGSTYMYVAVAAYASLIAERTVKSARDIVLLEQVDDLENNDTPRHRSLLIRACNHISTALDWHDNKYVMRPTYDNI